MVSRTLILRARIWYYKIQWNLQNSFCSSIVVVFFTIKTNVKRLLFMRDVFVWPSTTPNFALTIWDGKTNAFYSFSFGGSVGVLKNLSVLLCAGRGGCSFWSALCPKWQCVCNVWRAPFGDSFSHVAWMWKNMLGFVWFGAHLSPRPHCALRLARAGVGFR